MIASLVCAGGAFAYGVAAGGAAGAQQSFDILESELRCALGQLGVQEFSSVSEKQLMSRPGS